MSQIQTQVELVLGGSNIISTGTTYTEDPASLTQLDMSNYDGTITCYFEADLYNNNSSNGATAYVQLYNHTDSVAVSGSEVTAGYNSGNTKRVRSGAITLSGNKTYTLMVKNTINNQNTVYWGARIIIVQSGTITKTQIHQEIGANHSTSSTSNTNILAHAGWFLYQANKYDGIITIQHVASMIATSGNTTTSGIYDMTASAVVSGSEVSTTATTYNVQTSGAITLIDGHYYRPTFYVSGGASVLANTNKIVFTITGSPTKFLYYLMTSNNGIGAYTTTSSSFSSASDSTVMVNTTNYSNCNVNYYHEADISISNAAQTVTAELEVLNESTLTASSISGTQVSHTGDTNRTPVRSSAFTFPSGDTALAFGIKNSDGSSTAALDTSYLVLEVTNLGGTADTITASDTVTDSDVTRGYSDTVATREQTQLLLASTIAVSDSTAVAESVNMLIPALPNVITDSVTTNESVDVLIVSLVDTTDSTSTSEAIGISTNTPLAVSDATTASIVPLKYKTGTFTKSTTTGNQAVTGIGFTPAAVILLAATNTSNGSFLAGMNQVIGVFTGTTQQSSVSAKLAYDGTNMQSGITAFDSAFAGPMTFPLGQRDVDASLVSFDSDGFTLNWARNTSDGWQINYIALSGGSAFAASVVRWQMPTTIGLSSVTGVGFKPSLLFNLYLGNVSGWGGWVSAEGVGNIGIGMADANHNEWATHSSASDNVATTHQRQLQITNGSIVQIDPSGTNALTQASVHSFDSDGFTYNFSTPAPNTNISVVTLAITGVRAHVGSFSKATVTGNQAITGIGFTPSNLLVAGYGDVNSTTAFNQSALLLGAYDGTTQTSLSTYVADSEAASANVGSSLTKTNKIYVKTTDGASPSITAEGAINSLDNDGFTLNWTTNDATADQVLYLAMAPASGEQIQLQLSYAIAVSDSTTTGENTVIALEGYVNPNDTVTTSESISLLVDANIVNSDNTATSENISIFIPATASIVVSDSVSGAEALVFSTTNIIAVSDTSTTAESINPSNPLSIAITDTASTSESVATASIMPGLILVDVPFWAEAITINIVTAGDLNVVTNDNGHASELLVFNEFGSTQVSDTDTVSEFIDAELNSFASLSDTPTTSENVKTVVEANITVTDSVSTSENVATLEMVLIGSSDVIATSEATQPALVKQITVSDSTAISESVTTRFLLVIVKSENVTTSEALTVSVQTFINLNLTVSDAATTNEQLAFSTTNRIVTNDTTTAAETLVPSITNFVAVSDNATSTESVVTSQTYNLAVSDNITASDPVVLAVSNVLLIVSDSSSTMDVVILSQGGQELSIVVGPALQKVHGVKVV